MKNFIFLILILISSKAAIAQNEAKTVICGVEMNLQNSGLVDRENLYASVPGAIESYRQESKCKDVKVCLIQGAVAVACDAKNSRSGINGSEALYWKLQ